MVPFFLVESFEWLNYRNVKNKVKSWLKKTKAPKAQIDQVDMFSRSFPHEIRSIDDTNDNDVFVVGYPKSGNTLMQHVISHLVYNLNEETSRSIVNILCPDIHANKYYNRINDRCYFKSHMMPQPSYKNVIYIVRDGRQALLSYFHMVKNMGGSIELNDLYNDRIKLFGCTWGQHVESWANNPFNANILWIKYEDLIGDKTTTLKKIAEFTGLPRTIDEINNVDKFTSIDFMKLLEKKADWVKMKGKKFQNTDKEFVREGKSRGYRNEVDEDLIKLFEQNNLSTLKRFYETP